MSANFTNIFYTADNLFILSGLNNNLVDLIYLDPPFNSKRIYSAPVGSKASGSSFKDIWTWEDVNEEYLVNLDIKCPGVMEFMIGVGKIHSKAMMAYLTYVAQRLVEMHRILKDTGSLYLHCDHTASHYLKLLLDLIFGKNNFRNEIVWAYTGRLMYSANKFCQKNDIIYFYSKTPLHKINEITEKIDKKQYIKMKRQKLHTDLDGREWIWGHSGAGKSHDHKIYLDEVVKKGKKLSSVWNIPIINTSAKERTGYPTQKPLALLNRIIQASSHAGDIIMDPFCGSATTCVAAQQLGRKWIGIDIEKQAVNILVDRLSTDTEKFKDFINTTEIPQRTDVQYEPNPNSLKNAYTKSKKASVTVANQILI